MEEKVELIRFFDDYRNNSKTRLMKIHFHNQ
jgi:hypothetical protein